jgi:hypothetical protein
VSRVAVLWDEWADEDLFGDGFDALPLGGLVPSTVTFPTTRLVTRVQIALGADLTQPSTSWAWADITSYVRQDLGISWSTGRPDGSGQVGYGRAALKLDNRDGRFSRRNPNSPYFGLLTRNTPIWVTVDAGSGVRDRIQMFVNEWPVRWSDESATDSTVTIQCSGALRRLGQGGTLAAAMRRRILSPDEPAPAAYWPCEDGTEAIAVASGLPGGSAMTPFSAGDVPVFGAGFGGSTGSLDFLAMPDDGGVVGNAVLASASGFQVEFMALSNAGATVFDIVQIDSGTFEAVIGMSAAAADGQPHHFAFRCVQNGPNVDVTSYRDGIVGATNSIAGVLTTSVAVASRNPAQGTTLLFAQLAIYNFASINAPTTRAPAATAYSGELATTRIRRVCAEERVPVLCTSGNSVAMGPQPVGKLLDILRDAESVDQGVLYETAWGLGFQACNDRTNIPVALALDFNQRHIADTPEPADDDQRLRNRWTVSRVSGSSYVKQLTTGQTGTTLAGVYDDSATVNVQLDSQLADQAGWRLNIGTADGDRWPSIPLNFTRNPTLIDTWTTLPYGQRMTVSNPPAQMPPDVLDLVIEGFSEGWTPFNWFATLNASPFAPYLIGTLATDTGDTASTLLILTPDTLTLAADVDTTAISWSVNSSPVWTTNSEMFPRRIIWEGEEIRLDNCTGASAPQTWTVVRSVNGIVKAHTAGSTGRILNPGVLALA